MLNTKTFLTVDFGAGSLKLAEFETNDAGGLSLKSFAIKPLGLEGSQDATREATILKALQETLVEKGIKSKNVNVCAPGFHVFSKFVKLPPVDATKVTQIIQYEAQQNVPFPLAEVVWDYQILGSAASGELEVLLVAIKSEVVEGLFRVAAQAKLKLSLCDASPAALCNAFRYNYGDLEDCTMLLDIGAKTSNLLFFEKGKVFSRSINLGANTITQDFANESKLKFDEADKIKIAEGFVSLGGAYEEPENAHQAAISKIARQFMTKLHIQVNQTIQFYRGQQGGAQPQRLFLSGGASIMPYTAQFFAEKLNIPVEYFNPLRNVQIDPAVNLEELARVAHSLGEVVGLGLRNLAHCPVEMNLMPESTLRWQAFNERKPYFLATVFSLVLVAFAVGFLYEKLAQAKEKEIEDLQPKVTAMQAKSDSFKRVYSKFQTTQKEAAQITTWMEDRYYWGDVLTELRGALIRSEDDTKKKLSAQKPGVEAGIWIEQLSTDSSLGTASGAPAYAPPMRAPGGGYGGYGGGMPGGMPAAAAPAADASGAAAVAPGSVISLVCRAVNLTSVDPSANSEIAYAVENQLKSSTNYFKPEGTQLTGQITPDDASGTFTFGVTVTLLNPLKL
jgi:type IV pilus assembly protein PilM